MLKKAYYTDLNVIFFSFFPPFKYVHSIHNTISYKSHESSDEWVKAMIYS